MSLMKTYNKNYYPILISVMLHCMVLLFCVEFSTEKTLFGHDQPSTISSYIYQDHTSKWLTTTKNQSNITAAPSSAMQQAVSVQGLQKSHATGKKITNTFLGEKHRTTNTMADHPVAQQTIKQSLASQGQLASELVALLHAAIQEKQHYPLSAQQMEREGRVTVMFTLFVDGTIRHLRITQSSGTTSLDEAAIEAVNNAAPFTHVDKFLQEPKEHAIDVVFTLT